MCTLACMLYMEAIGPQNEILIAVGKKSVMVQICAS